MHNENPEPALSICNPDGYTWNGTFGVLVRTLADDLLSDGEPLEITVHTADEAITGDLTARNGETLVIDGRTIAIEDVLRVDVD